jgi:NitT/TauT family transport system substrate-binding protein
MIHMAIGRRMAFATVLALVGMIPMGAPPAHAQATSQGAGPLIRVGTGPNDQSLSLVYGDKGGVFRRHGLNVEVSRQTTTATMAAAVVGGSLEIAQGSTLGAIQALARGLPLTLIGNLAYYNAEKPDIGLLVLANSAIRAPKDLEGKTLAGVALSDMNSISTVMWLEQRGVDVSTLKFVEIPASASLAALEQNRISAATVYEPFYSAFLASGKVRALGYPYEALGKHYSNSVLYAETKWAGEHRELIERFLRALQEASAYVAAHEAETSGLLATFAGLDPATMANVKHPERGVAISPADIQPIIDAAVKFKVIPKAFAAQDVMCVCALRK